MKSYTKVYLKAFGYTSADFIPCEICGDRSSSIHHVKPKSAFGSRTKHLQDDISNLVALCFTCHDKVHCRDVSLNEKIKEIVSKRQAK